METLNWNNLSATEQQQALTRPAISASNEIKSAVENIVKFVQQEGDKALFELTEKFDKIKLDSLIVKDLNLRVLKSTFLHNIGCAERITAIPCLPAISTIIGSFRISPP